MSDTDVKLLRPNDKPETRANRCRRVLSNAAELAALCTTHHWQMDHGHLCGLRDHKRGDGDPVLIEGTNRVLSSYIDVAKPVTDKDHRVTSKNIGYDGRADLRLMASMAPNVVLQLREDFEQIIADYEARIVALEADVRMAEGDAEAAQHGM